MSSANTQRRLAAILAADVVDSLRNSQSLSLMWIGQEKVVRRGSSSLNGYGYWSNSGGGG